MWFQAARSFLRRPGRGCVGRGHGRSLPTALGTGTGAGRCAPHHHHHHLRALARTGTGGRIPPAAAPHPGEAVPGAAHGQPPLACTQPRLCRGTPRRGVEPAACRVAVPGRKPRFPERAFSGSCETGCKKIHTHTHPPFDGGGAGLARGVPAELAGPRPRSPHLPPADSHPLARPGPPAHAGPAAGRAVPTRLARPPARSPRPLARSHPVPHCRGSAWHGMAWHDMARHGTARCTESTPGRGASEERGGLLRPCITHLTGEQTVPEEPRTGAGAAPWDRLPARGRRAAGSHPGSPTAPRQRQPGNSLAGLPAASAVSQPRRHRSRLRHRHGRRENPLCQEPAGREGWSRTRPPALS